MLTPYVKEKTGQTTTGILLLKFRDVSYRSQNEKSSI